MKELFSGTGGMGEGNIIGQTERNMKGIFSMISKTVTGVLIFPMGNDSR